MTDSFEEAVNKAIFHNQAISGISAALGSPGSVHTSLHTGAGPGETGTQATNEIAYTGYARIAKTRNATEWPFTTPDIVDNGTAHTFGEMTGGAGGTVTYAGLGEDLSGAGPLWLQAAVTTSKAIALNDTPSFPIGAIVVTAS